MSERAADGSQLTVRMSARGQVRDVGLLGLLGLLYPVAWLVGLVDGWVAVGGAVVFASIGLFGASVALRSRRWPPVAVFGPDGIDVCGGRLVAWWEVSHLVVSGLQPSWFFVLGRRRTPVVAVVPQPGVELPALRTPGGSGIPGMRSRLYGTDLLFLPRATTATVDDLAAAALRFGGKETEFRW